MDRIIEKTRVLKENLDEIELFKEYKKVKKEVDENREIKTIKRDIVRAKNEGRIDEHNRLLNDYNNHHLILNYNNLKEEVYFYLKEISDILNK